MVAAGILITGAAPPLETTGEVAVTPVTLPEPLLLNVFQSVDVKYPLTEPVAAGILIAGVVPPLDTTGAVPVTAVTTVPRKLATLTFLVVPLCTKGTSSVPTNGVVAAGSWDILMFDMA